MTKILEGIATSDFHLDAWRRFFSSGPLAVAAQLREIEKPFRYSVDHGIQRLFVLGDTGEEPWLSEEAKDGLLDLLCRYDGKLFIEILLGNHDFATEGLNNLANFLTMQKHKKFSTVRFHTQLNQMVIDDMPVNFMPYPFTVAPERDTPCLNLAHVEISGAKRDNGRVTKEGEGIQVTDGKDFWLTGHFHTYQEGTNYLYPGNVFQKNFGEPLPKGFVHFRCELTPDGNIHFRHRFIESTPQITLHNLTVLSEEDYAKIGADLNCLYKLKISRSVKLSSPHITAPNVVDYEYLGSAPSHSGLEEGAEASSAEASPEHDVLGREIDPTKGLERVLMATLDDVDLVRVGVEMARKAAVQAFAALEVS